VKTPRELQALYEQGTNISALLREEQGLQRNTREIIEIAYELQTGSYTAAMQAVQMATHKSEYAREIANTIRALCQPESILEAGVGEATTLSGVLQHLGADIDSFGFDLSWSRVAYAKRWLQSQGLTGATLCTGDLFHIPFADSSIDVVYTSHSIEPNGGGEEPILQELYRVSRKFLILLEPGFELAGAEARLRMESHGYCKDLNGKAKRLGLNVVKHELFPHAANPLNPTAITIIKKDSASARPAHILACPKFKTPLEAIGEMLFSPEALVVYPVVAGIPCLRIENGILASKYKEFIPTP
jgi:uncharacterized protein YbaR (Trm112 family)